MLKSKKHGIFKSTPLLVTDKIPLVLIENAKICMKNGSVVAQREAGNTNIPIGTTHMVLIGSGTSITNQAAIECARQNCYVSFVTGGCSSISIMNDGRFQNPEPLTRQVLLSQDDERRLVVGKKLLNKRIDRIRNFMVETVGFSTTGDIQRVLEVKEKIDESTSIVQLTSYEGVLVKKIYSLYAKSYGVPFAKAGDSKINTNLNILNSAFYNFVSSIILSLGFSPSIGVIHGKTRRGAFALDIADIYKASLILPIAFGLENSPIRILCQELFSSRKKIVKEMIEDINSCWDADC